MEVKEFPSKTLVPRIPDFWSRSKETRECDTWEWRNGTSRRRSTLPEMSVESSSTQSDHVECYAAEGGLRLSTR